MKLDNFTKDEKELLKYNLIKNNKDIKLLGKNILKNDVPLKCNKLRTFIKYCIHLLLFSAFLFVFLLICYIILEAKIYGEKYENLHKQNIEKTEIEIKEIK